MSETISMVRATSADAEDVRALTRSAYAKWVAVIGREPKPMGADYAHAVENHRIDLLYRDGVLAALIEMIPQPDHLLIENVAVSPDFQKRGLGRALMTHAEAVAAAMGLGLLRLYTNQRFEENVRLYQGLGYQIDSEEAFAGGVVVHMSKALRGLFTRRN
ncbi:MAG: GNAT family N-acetyltransferase [Caulobacteraceae bacterium]|nr:GNAT family N-acetyltransferase [Caulobacteraceae bacterium]